MSSVRQASVAVQVRLQESGPRISAADSLLASQAWTQPDSSYQRAGACH